MPARPASVPIEMATPVSTITGVARMYRDTSFIWDEPMRLPRYSGVRPTIRPAMNTVTMARMSMPYRPDPVPPGATSPSIMLNITVPPPNAV